MNISELMQVVFEKWKYQIMIKITKAKSEIMKIADEQNGEIVHNVIGFQSPSTYEEELDEDDNF